MSKILITDKINLEIFKENLGEANIDYRPGLNNQEISEIIKNYDIVIVKPRVELNSGVLENSGIRVIGVLGNGTENIDMEFVKEKNIEVLRLPDESVESVAEYTIAMMINIARGIVQAHGSIKSLKWDKDLYHGTQLKGSVLGVLGMGKIGLAVAERAKAIGMKVIGYDPYVKSEEWEIVDSLDEFLKRSQMMAVHVPLLENTKNLISQKEVDGMDGMLIVNSSRAGIFHKESLIEGLKSGKIRGYATDVHYNEPVKEEDRELIEMENVICTPHIGAQTIDVQNNIAKKMAEMIKPRL